MANSEFNRANRPGEVLSLERKRRLLEEKFNHFYYLESLGPVATGPWSRLLAETPEARSSLFVGVNRLTEQQIDLMIELMKKHNLWQ